MVETVIDTNRDAAFPFPINIVFRDFAPTESIHNSVYDQIERLLPFHRKISSCQVAISEPHRHKNNGRIYHIGIKLGLRGRPVYITREPEQNAEHEDIYIAIRHAFDAAKKRLQSLTEKRRAHRNFGSKDGKPNSLETLAETPTADIVWN
jgi:ribosome-associated translation inhibitor RaiA